MVPAKAPACLHACMLARAFICPRVAARQNGRRILAHRCFARAQKSSPYRRPQYRTVACEILQGIRESKTKSSRRSPSAAAHEVNEVRVRHWQPKHSHNSEPERPSCTLLPHQHPAVTAVGLRSINALPASLSGADGPLRTWAIRIARSQQHARPRLAMLGRLLCGRCEHRLLAQLVRARDSALHRGPGRHDDGSVDHRGSTAAPVCL